MNYLGMDISLFLFYTVLLFVIVISIIAGYLLSYLRDRRSRRWG